MNPEYRYILDNLENAENNLAHLQERIKNSNQEKDLVMQLILSTLESSLSDIVEAQLEFVAAYKPDEIKENA